MVPVVAFIPNPGNLSGCYLRIYAAGIPVRIVSSVESENLCHGLPLRFGLLWLWLIWEALPNASMLERVTLRGASGSAGFKRQGRRCYHQSGDC